MCGLTGTSGPPWPIVGAFLGSLTREIYSGVRVENRAPMMGHGGPLVPVSPREVTILFEPYFGIARVSPPLYRDPDK